MMKIKTITPDGMYLHSFLIEQEVHRLQDIGYKQVPVTNIAPIHYIPDAILVSDKEVVLLEVVVTCSHSFSKSAIEWLRSYFGKPTRIEFFFSCDESRYCRRKHHSLDISMINNAYKNNYEFRYEQIDGIARCPPTSILNRGKRPQNPDAVCYTVQILIAFFKCNICKHEWLPKFNKIPKWCPSCSHKLENKLNLQIDRDGNISVGTNIRN